jgi:hypothetical protein
METVQHLAFTAGAEDVHGNATGTWGAPVDVQVKAFDPGSSEEPRRSGQHRVVTTPQLFLDAASVFAPRDRVIVRGKTYEVDGETQEWRNPRRRRAKGNVVALRRVDG